MRKDNNIQQWNGHNGAVYDVLFWPALRKWASAGGDGLVAAWNDAGEGAALLHHNEPFFSVGRWGNRLVAGTQSGEVFAMQTNGEDTRRWKAHTQGTFAFTTSSSGALITGGGDGCGQMWSLAANMELIDEGPAWQKPLQDKIRCFVSNPLGQTLVGSSDGTARLWDQDVRSLSHPIARHEGGVYCGAWHPRKGLWITGGRDGHLRAHRSDGEEVLSLPAHEGAIYRMVIARGALWTAGRDKCIKIWDLNTMQPTGRIDAASGGHRRSVNALAVRKMADDQDLMLSGGDDRTLLLHGIP